jgi:hypothetical protein
MNQQYQELTSVKQAIIPEQHVTSPATWLQSRQGLLDPVHRKNVEKFIM